MREGEQALERRAVATQRGRPSTNRADSSPPAEELIAKLARITGAAEPTELTEAPEPNASRCGGASLHRPRARAGERSGGMIRFRRDFQADPARAVRDDQPVRA